MSDPTATEAREEAREILSEGRFGERGGEGGDGGSDPIGDALREVGNWIDGITPDAEFSPDLSWLIWGAIVAVVIFGAVRLARGAIRRRVEMAPEGASAGAAESARDPRGLERLANEAERAGDTVSALRLRFEAGLLRLASAGAIRLRPSLTPRGAARQVRSPLLDELVSSFEGVVYGGREPSDAESRAARENWALILSDER